MRGIGPILYVLILGASPLAAQIADELSMPVSVIANREEVLAANDAIDRERTPRHSEPCRERGHLSPETGKKVVSKSKLPVNSRTVPQHMFPCRDDRSSISFSGVHTNPTPSTRLLLERPWRKHKASSTDTEEVCPVGENASAPTWQTPSLAG